MKKFLNFITSRVFITSIFIILQLFFLLIAIIFLSSYFIYLYITFIVLSIVMAFYIVARNTNPVYKIAWIFPILIFPVVGGIFYLLFDRRNVSPKMKKELYKTSLSIPYILSQKELISKNIKNLSPDAFKQSTYIKNVSNFPIYQNTSSKILPSGMDKLEELVFQLNNAKEYIFLEYFIIEPGEMWDTVLDILVKKVKQGLDVRLIYDDMGTISILPKNYDKFIKSLGIKVIIFNMFKPSLDVFMNYRDHRKIVIIDGHTAFTGGINLADEYINKKIIHGHWKDLSIMIKGEAVFSFTIMFLQIWDYHTNKLSDYLDYKPNIVVPSDGFVQPFADSPIDEHLIAEMAYINMINMAKNYIYITTPYLILDNEMITALCLASNSGIDVKIITPFYPDKWYVHEVTRSNYAILISAGVKIYEYTPGFIHSKTIIVDDTISIVSTSNFDFRSFYLHFECGVFLFKTSCIRDILKYFFDTLKNCQIVTLESVENINIFRKFIRNILKFFSPIM